MLTGFDLDIVSFIQRFVSHGFSLKIPPPLLGSQTTVLVAGGSTLLAGLGRSLSVTTEAVLAAHSLVGGTILLQAIVGRGPESAKVRQ